MSRVQVPFQRPPVRVRDITSSRFRADVRQSENRAVFEILNAPEYQAIVDTLEVMRSPFDEQGRRKRGRTAEIPATLILMVVVIALVLDRDLRAARHRLYSDPELRAHAGLDPLTEEQVDQLRSVTGDVIRDPNFPSEEAIRDFVSRWTRKQVDKTGENKILRMLADARLAVAADVINRHNLSCGWVAVDGKRARAATNEPDGDEGTKVHSRGGREESFNQRHIYPAILGSAPLIIDQFITPPAGEITYWAEEGIPSLQRSGDRLAAVINDMRTRDGNPARHPGLRHAAVASDGALANETGHRALIAHRFSPAAIKPQAEPTYDGYITVRQGDELLRFDLRSDGAVLCPHCGTHEQPVSDRTPMTPGAGEWGENIRARCPDNTCPGRTPVKIPLRGPDRNDYLPGSTISRGETSYTAISILPTWSAQYIAHRFLSLERVEWTHAMFEQKYGLGGKNPGTDRRKIKGTHANRIWWAVASLIWNLEIRANLDSGRGTITPVLKKATKKTKPDEKPYTLASAVAGFWTKDADIQEKKDLRRRREEKEQADLRRKIEAEVKANRAVRNDPLEDTP